MESRKIGGSAQGVRTLSDDELAIVLGGAEGQSGFTVFDAAKNSRSFRTAVVKVGDGLARVGQGIVEVRGGELADGIQDIRGGAVDVYDGLEDAIEAFTDAEEADAAERERKEEEQREQQQRDEQELNGGQGGMSVLGNDGQSGMSAVGGLRPFAMNHETVNPPPRTIGVVTVQEVPQQTGH